VAEPAPKLPSNPGFKPGNTPEFSVSDLASAIKRALEDGFGHVRLKGEISGYRGPHASGHCYFALKDDAAKIDAVIWKGVFGRLKFRPEEGMEVIATGRVTSYPGSSKYQIVIEQMEPAGVGALMALLEERKRRFTAEGLFAADRKRALPFMPRVVGIVTSPTGAVIRDMLAGFTERFPVRVLIWPVRVQGETSGAEVAAAIAGFNAIVPGGRLPRPDVLIVARGGGSLEDLWGFNDEVVVRAAAQSTIPIVSAVGHETDWTLLDLVADARAPTPTKAAEWVVPKYSDLLAQSADLSGRLAVGMRRALEHARAHLRAAARGLPRVEDLVRLPRQRFDSVERRLGRGLLANTKAHGMRHARIASRLQPRLVEVRLQRTRDRLETHAARARDGLARLTNARRVRFERAAGGLQPRLIAIRLARTRDNLAGHAARLSQALHRATGQRRFAFERAAGQLRAAPLQSRIASAGERLSALEARGVRAMAHRLAQRRQRLEATAQMLAALSYQGVLDRGFALLRDGNGAMVRRAGAVVAGAALSVEMADGTVRVQAIEDGRTKAGGGDDASAAGRADPAQPVRPVRPAKPRAGPSGDPGNQGSLF
jgi:exodeoxyribonuclease VII large subunit